MSISAYPLQWPQGWKRTEPQRRREAKFGRARQAHGGSYVAGRPLTMTEAVHRLLGELRAAAHEFTLMADCAAAAARAGGDDA